jgi:hypothetical protein
MPTCAFAGAAATAALARCLDAIETLAGVRGLTRLLAFAPTVDIDRAKPD